MSTNRSAFSISAKKKEQVTKRKKEKKKERKKERKRERKRKNELYKAKDII